MQQFNDLLRAISLATYGLIEKEIEKNKMKIVIHKTFSENVFFLNFYTVNMKVVKCDVIKHIVKIDTN